MIESIIKFITSDKFYLPLVFILVAIISYKIISKTIIRASKIDSKLKVVNKGYEKRKITVVSLINNIIKYIIAIIVVIMILNVYGVNTGSILASLGIVGAVIGLAFQDIIKDFIAGVFIIFDNAYAVGDIVTINDFKGEVISMGLKTTKIKSITTGEVMVLSNSSFNKVINYNLSTPIVHLTIPFSYKEKIEKIEETLEKTMQELMKEDHIKEYKLLGVDSFEESSIKYALDIYCSIGTERNIKRLALKAIKQSFDKSYITIPYNQLDVHIDKKKRSDSNEQKSNI